MNFESMQYDMCLSRYALLNDEIGVSDFCRVQMSCDENKMFPYISD
jgi:hypothetical protein